MIKFPTSAVNPVSICLLAISTGAGVKFEYLFVHTFIPSGFQLCAMNNSNIPIIYSGPCPLPCTHER